jgi:hypothetical protein
MTVLQAGDLLTRGVGTWVKDTEAVELADGSNITATGTGSWVEALYPGVVIVEATTGTCTGTSVVCDVEIQAADDSSGTNPVSLGTFATIDEDSDDETRVLVVELLGKPYVRYSATVAGSTPVVPLTIVLRDKDYHQSDARTA